MPAATDAAAPPLDPPGVCAGDQDAGGPRSTWRSTRHPGCGASDYSPWVLVVAFRCAIGTYCRSRAPV